MKTEEIRRSEDAVQAVIVKGFKCKRCKRFSMDERMARYCCSNDFPCECGGRHTKGWVYCKKCRDKNKHDKWYAKEEIEWNGEFPIALWDNDVYFFDDGELMDYFYDDMDVPSDELPNIDSAWLTTCKPSEPRHFEMSEYLCDSLPEDADIDEKEINKIVNGWISENGPFSFLATGKRLSIKSVKESLGK